MGNEVKKPMNLLKGPDSQKGKLFNKVQTHGSIPICLTLSTVAFRLQRAEGRKGTYREHRFYNVTICSFEQESPHCPVLTL